MRLRPCPEPLVDAFQPPAVQPLASVEISWDEHPRAIIAWGRGVIGHGGAR